MNWYKTLTIEQRINLKELSELICGIRFETLISIFGFYDAIELLYNKLQIEGFLI